MVQLNAQTLVTYGIAIVVPILFLSFRLRSAKSKPTPVPEESSTKPLKPIMQAPNADLAPPKDDPFTVEELAQYTGEDPSKPIYVAIKV
ncbi:hypothetical protein NMY22_g660 [Coprinellus aureogranulatus]|nr:hypothetical protein NMY22_g660 [Coprinellus aureogranulatus]